MEAAGVAVTVVVTGAGRPADELQRLYRRVPLTQGKETWVDPFEYERVTAFKWYAHNERGHWYAMRAINIGGRQVWQSMHTFLTGFELVDHRDRNGLHNWHSNLRKATYRGNAQNTGLRSTNTSGLKGVHWRKDCGRWQAYIKAHLR